MHLRVLALVCAAVAPLAVAAGQSRASQLVDSARAQATGQHLDSAAALLRAALALDSTIDVPGLDRLSPELAQTFRQEKQAAARRAFVYVSSRVDDPPRRLSGPPVAYPPVLLRRRPHPQGFVDVAAIIDTLGRAMPATVNVLATPDSALIEPVRDMMVASQFSTGHVKGTAVRVMVEMTVSVRPPRLSATDLVGTARQQVAAGRSDSALALLDLALDSSLTHLTEGERVYALLVEGVAASRAGRDSVGRKDFRDGLALYKTLTARGVDLAPFLRRLADSVRLAGAMPAPTIVGTADAAPTLVFRPPIRYPPELQALRVDGIVMVEAAVDATGHVEPGSGRVVESPNHGFDAEALRVVRGSVYRPARSNGRAVRAVIRQAISFVNY
ncbi:MAG TPA: energy transducer TonB [Gemmatimonadales bacterium]|nr:energy transducer TonB [Gemmatimonadales bacterium]